MVEGSRTAWCGGASRDEGRNYIIRGESTIGYRELQCCINPALRPLTFLMIKPTRCTSFLKFYFGMKLCSFRTDPTSIIRSYSLYTQQWYMSYRFVDSFRAGWNRMELSSILFHPAAAQKLSVWHIPLLSVQWITRDDGQRNCPKHIEFLFFIFWVPCILDQVINVNK
jgi:hypothetical protein